jgi:hypothetical protein
MQLINRFGTIKDNYMKMIFLALILLAFINIGAKAQSSISNLDSAIIKNRKVNGTVLINTDETGLNLYVVYKNKKVSDIYAISKTGKKIIPIYQGTETLATAKKKKEIETHPMKCKVCLESEGKIFKCWEIECSLAPPPK